MDFPEHLVARRMTEFEKAGLLGRTHCVYIPTGCAGWHIGRGLRLGPGQHEVAASDQVLLYRDGEFELEFQSPDLVIDGRQLVQAQVSQWLCVRDPSLLQVLVDSKGDVPYDTFYERGLPDLRLGLTGVLRQYGPIPVRDDPRVRRQAERELERTLLERWQPYGLTLSSQRRNGAGDEWAAVQIRSVSVDDDRLAAVRIREEQLRQLAEDMDTLEGEALLRARQRQAELQMEVTRLDREVALEQAETARLLHEAERQDRAFCPIGQHDVPRTEMFLCANPRCERRVCLAHLDPRGRDDIQGRICLDCGKAWREQQEKATQGLKPCAECGRVIRQEASFRCKECGRDWLCVDACLHQARRICIGCAAKAAITAATPQPRAAGGGPTVRQLLALADWPETLPVRVWVNTPSETARRVTRDVAVVPKADRACFRTGQTISVSVQSDRRCYLTLLNVGPTRNLSQLLPNFWRRCNLLRANTTWILPDPLMARDFSFQIQPPAGRELIVAIGSLEPLTELSSAELTSNSPFHRVLADRAPETLEKVSEQLRSRKPFEWGLGYCEFEHDGHAA